jgi:multiple sugar transport system substrate-binding protein
MKKIAILLCFVILMTCFSGCGQNGSTLSTENPITLTMWHVYGSQTISPLNTVIDEFNRSLGSEYGISEMQPIKSNLCSQTPNIYINTTNSSKWS